jgi:Uroporphyrinogen decarboxylase (URO-D)
MTSRERVQMVIEHKEPDRVPLDLGACTVTGMHVDTVYKLRQALHLDEPGTPVKVMEPSQMLGEIKPDLMEALGVDVAGLVKPTTKFGFKNEDWKPWTTFEGTPVLVPGGFNTDPEQNGDILMYPGGDKSVPPSARMPKGGFYFDSIVRQPPIDENALNVEANLEEFGPITDGDLEHLRREAERLYSETDKAVLANFGGTGFGDIANVPGPGVKHPRGIRDIEEWYISTVTRRDYVYRVFERQCEIGIKNLERIFAAVGNRVTAVYVTGTDFGQQNGPFISLKSYRDLFKPFHQEVTNWVRKNTQWKCFIHSCGSVRALLPDFIDEGFDIINPVQCSAAGMAPEELKKQFGERVTFWGGGVDTQRTLPFGTPEEVRQEVCSRLKIFGHSGGYVFNPTHNVQARVPVENVLAMYQAVRELGKYPL